MRQQVDLGKIPNSRLRLCHVTKKLLVEFISRVKHKHSKTVTSRPRAQIWIDRICWQVSTLSNIWSKHLSTVLSREYRAVKWHTCTTSCAPCVVVVNNKSPNVCICHLKFSFVTSPCITVTIRCNVERNDKDAYDRDVYGGTKIEMSNYPALLTHIGLSSCVQTIQHSLWCR